MAGVPLPRSSLIYSDSIGVVLHETTDLDSSYAFTGEGLYVRARVVSRRGQANPPAEGGSEMAWGAPDLGGGSPGERRRGAGDPLRADGRREAGARGGGR